MRRLLSVLTAFLCACGASHAFDPTAEPRAQTAEEIEEAKHPPSRYADMDIRDPEAEKAKSEVAQAAKPVAAKADAAKAYSGHGVGSVSPEILAKFPPKPAPAAIALRVQRIIELFGPSAGHLTDDGKRMVFGWRVSGQAQIWRIDGPRRFPVQLTSGEDRTGIAGIMPDGKTIVVTRDRNGEENPGLYLQNIEGGELQVIQHVPGVQTSFNYLTAEAIYFVSNDRVKDSYAVYRYNVSKRSKELLYDGPGIWSVSDVGPSGQLLLRKATGSLPSEYYELAPGAKEPTPLFGQGETTEYEARYGLKAGEVLVLTNKLGEFRRLYVWKSGQFTALSADEPHDVTSFTLDDDKKRLVYHVNDAGFTRPHVMSVRNGVFVADKTAWMPKADNVEVDAITKGGRYATVMIDWGNKPPSTGVVDFQTGKLEQWQDLGAPEVDTSGFVRASLESFPARDGTQIPAFVRRPTACSGRVCPVIVEFHGGPESQTTAGFDGRAQLFVDAGFVHVQPNVRGSDGYGKTYVAADDGAKRLNIITDIEDAATWAKKTFAVGNAVPKVGIYGGSYGGYSSLIGMTMFAGAYDAGVEVVGIANLVTFLNNTAPYRRILRISEYGDPVKDLEVLTKLSPTTYVDRAAKPLLILQGANDPRVPVGEAVQIYDAFAAKGVPVELMIFPDEGHGASKRANRVTMTGNAIRFFEEHLK